MTQQVSVLAQYVPYLCVPAKIDGLDTLTLVIGAAGTGLAIFLWSIAYELNRIANALEKKL